MPTFGEHGGFIEPRERIFDWRDGSTRLVSRDVNLRQALKEQISQFGEAMASIQAGVSEAKDWEAIEARLWWLVEQVPDDLEVPGEDSVI